MDIIIFTLGLRVAIMIMLGVILHVLLNKNVWGLAMVIFSIWLLMLQKFFDFAAINNIGGLKSNGEQIHMMLENGLFNASLELLLIISIMYFLYRLKQKKL